MLKDVRSGERCEIDYAYLMTGDIDGGYDLVIGEATRFSEFTDLDMEKAAKLSEKFNRKPYLAFSTLKDEFTDHERERLASLLKNGHRVIALTREELDAPQLYRRFENAPHKYAPRLKELSENTTALNVFVAARASR